MKNILKTITFALCLVALGSCEDDPDPIVSPNGFTLRTVDGPSSNLVLTPQQNDNNVAVLNWDKGDFGVGTTVSQYTVELAPAGSNFASPTVANAGNFIPSVQSYNLKVAELNNILNDFPGYECGKPMLVDIRIKSKLGGNYYNAVTQYSNTVTLDITPYSKKLPLMAFATSATITADTPKLAAGGVLNPNFEGYMYLTPGTYKFYQPDACAGFGSPAVFGDNNDGTFSGLEANGAGYEVTTANFYFVSVDMSTLKYTVRPIKWNYYGTAKQTFPASNVALTYNVAEKVWESNTTTPVRLAEGYGIKFRSDASTVLGTYNPAADNTALFGGNILTYLGSPLPVEGGPQALPYVFEVNVPGPKAPVRVIKSYIVKLDLNSPRDYKFSITEVPAP